MENCIRKRPTLLCRASSILVFLVCWVKSCPSHPDFAFRPVSRPASYLSALYQKVMYGYETDLYVCSKDGSHIKYYAYNKYLKENAKKVVEKKITTHALRHTHVSLLAENGISIDTISRRIGHSDSDITKQIYLHITSRLKEKENEQIKGLRII